MEMYREITLAELMASILNDNYKDIYYKNPHKKSLCLASETQWQFYEFKKYQWFVREVIPDENSKKIR